MNEQKTDKLHSTFGFTTPIPDEILQALPIIKPSGFAVWCYLMKRIYSNKREAGVFSCWPSINLICKDTGLSNKTVIKALEKLKDEGFIEKKKRFNGNTIYTLTSPRVLEKPPSNVDSTLPVVEILHLSNVDSTHELNKDNQEQLNQDKVNIINKRLKEIGITTSVRKKLIKDNNTRLLKHGIEVYEQGIAKKHPLKPGWLVSFFKEGWKDPDWYTVDSDSNESRQRYVTGEFADFWGEAEP
jgi:Fe2+ or Zn2+ uptake regulation protein